MIEVHVITSLYASLDSCRHGLGGRGYLHAPEPLPIAIPAAEAEPPRPENKPTLKGAKPPHTIKPMKPMFIAPIS